MPNRLSAIVQVADGTVKYYGNLKNNPGTSGTGVTVTIPSSLDPTDELLVFAEQVNADTLTDYASTPIEITPLATKIVTVGSQTDTLTEGTAGSATYTVTTANIANNSAIALTNTSSVAGIYLGTSQTTNDNTAVNINTTAVTPQGSHPLTLTIDGVTSASFDLVVAAQPITPPSQCR